MSPVDSVLGCLILFSIFVGVVYSITSATSATYLAFSFVSAIICISYGGTIFSFVNRLALSLRVFAARCL